ncbi:fluoride efflux transporter CrcB [Arthrobacter psychrochitiniphilus]|uniref:Fluoride-specific ion channel FluC n=1 Tax=Arthrobacter psychrochitiniphilus TaxID=291045 RepID=A0A2V3DVL8_9MICC|nr:fluoride efflux transporter CrcB [Arthrobacter psychrochitiniphilus]NYG17533.1 CrcB protein [Arthrobacter psychrochitiniphilus]PXA64638.1 fluoride efflux transporter CrcB [Arthrobacter psychrochitiniphilus]
MTVLLLALAGGVGAGLRFIVDGLVRARARTALPVGTILINVSGSLCLGLLTGLVAGHYTDSSWGLVLGVGLLGGYTTFSTASFETVRLIQSRRTWFAVVNSLGTVLACVLAATAGFALTLL